MRLSRWRPISTRSSAQLKSEKKLQDAGAGESRRSRSHLALGGVLRAHKKFAECADVYSKGVNLLGTPEKSNWVIFYFRGMCFERSHQWPKAEADLKKALELSPDQPQVMNYLGYSWIDQGTQPRRRHGHDQEGRAAEAGRRLHRRFARLGLLQARQLRGRGEAARARDRAKAARTRPSTIISATPIGGSDARSKRVSSGRMRAISSPSRRICRRSRRS